MKRYFLFLLPALLIGCTSEPPPAPEAGVDSSSNTETDNAETDNAETGVVDTAPAPEATKDMPLSIKSWEETQELVASHQGKVVVMDLWSTWCGPCKREFPHLVELSRKYPEQVACISFNINYDGAEDAPPESYREEALEFLNGQQANFDNVISSDADVTIYERLELPSIPGVRVYDQEGNLVKQFSGEFTYQDDVTPLVEKLLNDADA